MADTENPQTETEFTAVDSFLDRPDVQAVLSKTAGGPKPPSAHEYLGSVWRILDNPPEPDGTGTDERTLEALRNLRDQFVTELAASEGAGTPE